MGAPIWAGFEGCIGRSDPKCHPSPFIRVEEGGDKSVQCPRDATNADDPKQPELAQPSDDGELTFAAEERSSSFFWAATKTMAK
ncbi:unnamed protein product [Heligmosomoides polygyrus]|uniref:Uncharacterized protein n=1 Tax=Heligmosomoides polygyrus TaxID=6339 RepID=A0A183F9N5_HELPZ|nr:unnamed protein product [Heligmosomoides polygyrus]